MPDDFMIEEPEETLYVASRYWTHAGNEWDVASDWLLRATLMRRSLGIAYNPHSSDYVEVYNDCVHEIRDKLKDGAENLHGAAKALKQSAEEYVEVDRDLTRRIDGMIDHEGVEDPSPPDPGPVFGLPH